MYQLIFAKVTMKTKKSHQTLVDSSKCYFIWFHNNFFQWVIPIVSFEGLSNIFINKIYSSWLYLHRYCHYYFINSDVRSDWLQNTIAITLDNFYKYVKTINFSLSWYINETDVMVGCGFRRQFWFVYFFKDWRGRERESENWLELKIHY